MRKPRVKVESGYYHVMSRCALQAYLFEHDDKVKEMFLVMLQRAAIFSGVKVVNYCVMDNHFHLLIYVPKREEVSNEELEERIQVLYSAKRAQQILDRWKHLEEEGDAGGVVERERTAMRKRMYDLSEFMKTFKQRFTLWYCSHHDNLEGTIWQGVFHSVLIQGRQDALGAVSSYITLNPVRAGMVKDPGEYAWSSYGAACAGDASVRRALLSTYFGKNTIEEKWNAYKAMIQIKTAETAEAKDVVSGDSADEQTDEGSTKVQSGEKAKQAAEQRTVAVAMREQDGAMARGLAFGTSKFVKASVDKFCTPETGYPAARPKVLGERKMLLFCTGRLTQHGKRKWHYSIVRKENDTTA